MYISLDDLIFFHPDLYRLSFDDYGTVTQTPIPVIEDKRTFPLSRLSEISHELRHMSRTKAESF